MPEGDSSFDVAGFGKVADSKLVNKIYDDLLAPGFREVGQSLSVFIARLRKRMKLISESIPDEQRVEAQPSIAVPALLSLRWVEDGNPLTDLYVELLKRSIDRERAGDIHPAFVRTIDALSPDEARFLLKLRDSITDAGSHFCRVALYNQFVETSAFLFLREFSRWNSSLKTDDVRDWIERLTCLDLIRWSDATELQERRGASIIKTTPDPTIVLNADQIREVFEHKRWTPKRAWAVYFTRFGHRFVHACIPKDACPETWHGDDSLP